MAIQTLSAIFYMYVGLLASPCMARLQEALNFLTGLFDRVRLSKNVNKMFSMLCQPYFSAGRQAKVLYTWWITGGGPYRARQRYRVRCLDCCTELASGSIMAHRQTHHGRWRDSQWLEFPDSTRFTMDILGLLPKGVVPAPD